MKTTLQPIQSKHQKSWTTRLARLVLCIISSLGLIPDARAQVPFAVKFLAPSPEVRIWEDGMGLYLNSEPDVLAVSVFNFSTHDYSGKKLSPLLNRKIWMDLQGATLVPGTATPFTQPGSLPTGLFEGGMTMYAHNDEVPNCVTSGPGVLTMLPNEIDYRGFELEFTDGVGGAWRLRFGRFVCGTSYSSQWYSNCRLKLTGLDDLDDDGYSDVWVLEPEPDKNSQAYLLKVNKRQQFDPWGAFQVPFKLVVAKEQFAPILDLYN